MKKLKVLALAVILGLLSTPVFACTTAIISAKASGTGRPLLWKQRDTKNNYNHIEHIQGEKYSFTALVGTRKSEVKSVWAGVNEKGFVIANNVSYNINPKGEKAGRNGSLMMEVLGVCATVDDFERFLKKMPLPRMVASNYAVIDAVGGAAYFEVGNDTYTRFDVKDSPTGYLYRTNFSFEGREDAGKGYIRYDAARKLLGDKGSEFTSGWVLDNVARSFYHGLMKTDLKDKTDQELGTGFVISKDYIPRFTTTSSIVFEGVNPGESPKNVVMWNVLGYPPCSYAIPVWVGAGYEIPESLSSDSGIHAPANELAVRLKGVVFPIERGSGNDYLDYLTLRTKILPEVLAAEDKEIEEAEKLKEQFAAKGFNIKAVRKYNIEADRRFEEFKKKMESIIKK